MSRVQAVIVGLFIVSTASFSGTVYLYYQIDSERQARAHSEKIVADVQKALAENQKLLEEKSLNAASLDNQAAQLKAEIRTKNQEITKNRTKIAQQESKIKDLSEKLTLLGKEKTQLKTRLAYFEENQETEEPNTPDTPGQIASGQNVLAPKTVLAAPAVAPLVASNAKPKAALPEVPEGKVVLVNREYKFIVVDLGKLDGVKLKDEFEVVRDGKVIGKVAVSKLYESLSSCEILSESAGLFQEGDSVRAGHSG
ncbi:MAG: hypothetical protein HY586_02895 [Candidatus Omnitrophica bacterium]|nr:hypothetical protein [Candidatus Omnitrophota bacterium]